MRRRQQRQMISQQLTGWDIHYHCWILYLNQPSLPFKGVEESSERGTPRELKEYLSCWQEGGGGMEWSRWRWRERDRRSNMVSSAVPVLHVVLTSHSSVYHLASTWPPLSLLHDWSLYWPSTDNLQYSHRYLTVHCTLYTVQSMRPPTLHFNSLDDVQQIFLNLRQIFEYWLIPLISTFSKVW